MAKKRAEDEDVAKAPTCRNGIRQPETQDYGFQAAFLFDRRKYIRDGYGTMPVLRGVPMRFAGFRLPKFCVGWALVAHAGSGCLGCITRGQQVPTLLGCVCRMDATGRGERDAGFAWVGVCPHGFRNSSCLNLRRVGTLCPRGFRLPWVQRVGSKCPPYSRLSDGCNGAG